MPVFKILCSVSARTVFDNPCHLPVCYVESTLVHQWKTSWQQWSSVTEKCHAKNGLNKYTCSFVQNTDMSLALLKILSPNLTVNLYFFFLVRISWFQIYVFCGSSRSLHVSWNYSTPDSLHIPSNSCFTNEPIIWFTTYCQLKLFSKGPKNNATPQILQFWLWTLNWKYPSGPSWGTIPVFEWTAENNEIAQYTLIIKN